MMNLSLYIFGADYVTRGKLALVIDPLLAKPFGWDTSPAQKFETFLKV